MKEINLIGGNVMKIESHKISDKPGKYIMVHTNGTEEELNLKVIQNKILNLVKEENHIFDCASEVSQKVDELEQVLKLNNELPLGFIRQKLKIEKEV